jgi:hypothetical protein
MMALLLLGKIASRLDYSYNNVPIIPSDHYDL